MGDITFHYNEFTIFCITTTFVNYIAVTNNGKFRLKVGSCTEAIILKRSTTGRLDLINHIKLLVGPTVSRPIVFYFSYLKNIYRILKAYPSYFIPVTRVGIIRIISRWTRMHAVTHYTVKAGGVHHQGEDRLYS